MQTGKVLTAVFIVVAGILIGLYQSNKLKKRETALAEIIRMLEEISVQIRYRVIPVEQLIVEMSGRFEFINSVHIKMDKKANDYRSNQSWRSAWEECTAEYLPLKDEDRELLAAFGKQLGDSDLTGQLSMLELNKNIFNLKHTEAIEENLKKGKMYRSVGVLAGLGVATIFI